MNEKHILIGINIISKIRNIKTKGIERKSEKVLPGTFVKKASNHWSEEVFIPLHITLFPFTAKSHCSDPEYFKVTAEFGSTRWSLAVSALNPPGSAPDLRSEGPPCSGQLAADEYFVFLKLVIQGFLSAPFDTKTHLPIKFLRIESKLLCNHQTTVQPELNDA